MLYGGKVTEHHKPAKMGKKSLYIYIYIKEGICVACWFYFKSGSKVAYVL